MQDNNARFPTIAKVLIFRQFLWGAAFYGAFVLLTKFFLNDLNYSEADTIMMMGAFGAVGPVFSAVGGFLADKFIGAFRAVYIGYAVYLVGFLLLGIVMVQLYWRLFKPLFQVLYTFHAELNNPTRYGYVCNCKRSYNLPLH